MSETERLEPITNQQPQESNSRKENETKTGTLKYPQRARTHLSDFNQVSIKRGGLRHNMYVYDTM